MEVRSNPSPRVDPAPGRPKVELGVPTADASPQRVTQRGSAKPISDGDFSAESNVSVADYRSPGGAAAGGSSAHIPLARVGRPLLLIPLGVLFVLAALFVLWAVTLRRLLPTLSIGWEHGLLTAWAGVVTAVTSSGVYLVMDRQHRLLAATADHLARLLEGYKTDGSLRSRFENPHLVHCRDALHCTRTECPMYSSPGQRCWQVVALGGACRGKDAPEIELQQCHDCAVFRRSCPDKLTELGESFNNLMFLLEQENRQLGRMRSKLVEKEKMVAVGQMAAGVAHEIGNPLSSISSIVQMVKRASRSSSEPISDQLDLIQTHIQRISGTVRQMVSLARPSAATWELVDIDSLLKEVVALVSFNRKARSVKIDLSVHDDVPTTYGLRGELQQVFLNLALNALDAMSEGGTLTIRASRRRGDIAVEVCDTGCGIAPDVGRRVFEPFFTTKEPGQGTGLGLSVSYGIVQKHGGTIEFDSIVGEGTRFTVLLPILRKPPEG
ncbi:MAG: hypothetical protein J5J06_19150 [Phycisphaerae bacterium]|nr:hypothetical protein [Phycisphaerae bacterium]